MARLICTFILSICLSLPALAINENTTIIAHAFDGAFGSCAQSAAYDCVSTQPTLDVAGMTTPAVAVALRHHDSVSFLQVAFQIDPSWNWQFGLWDCQSNISHYHGASPRWGTGEGATLWLSFDAITGGSIAPIGRHHFSSAGSGCFEMVDSSVPGGTHVKTPSGVSTVIPPENRGRVCVGAGGHNACSPGAVPVAAASWGRVKAHYVHASR